MTNLDRRDFLRTTALGLSAFFLPLGSPRRARAAGTEPVWSRSSCAAAPTGSRSCVPHGDPLYYTLRPTLAVPAGTELDLDGFFGFHPALAPLLPLYASGRSSPFVHAVGSPDPTRSHFDAQDFMETAAPGDKGDHRRLAEPRARRARRRRPARAASACAPRPRARSRATRRTSRSAPSRRSRSAATSGAERRAALECALRDRGRASSVATWSTPSPRSTASLPFRRRPPPSTRRATSAARSRDAAALIKADVGVRAPRGRLGRLGPPRRSARAHRAARGAISPRASPRSTHDLGADAARTVVVVMTEFGRRAAENGGGGSDHGHGGVMLVLGGARRGRARDPKDGAWPGLGAGAALPRRGPRGDDRLPRRARRGARPPPRPREARVRVPRLRRRHAALPGPLRVEIGEVLPLASAMPRTHRSRSIHPDGSVDRAFGRSSRVFPESRRRSRAPRRSAPLRELH